VDADSLNMEVIWDPNTSPMEAQTVRPGRNEFQTRSEDNRLKYDQIDEKLNIKYLRGFVIIG
jgi:hypothetical protein